MAPRIAFIRWGGPTTTTFNPDIWVMLADGTDQRRLTTDVAWDHHPACSPDGARIVFTTRRDPSSPNREHLWTIRADGTGVAPLTPGTFNNAYPDWR